MNSSPMWMLIGSFLLNFLYTVDSYYDLTRRYYSNFYYKLSTSCVIHNTRYPGRYIDIYSTGLEPLASNIRILSVESRIGPADFRYRSAKILDDLEVYVMTGHVHRIKLTAPNLRAFTIVDTGQIAWENDTWQFPKLRAINIITSKVGSTIPIIVPSFGAKELFSLRLTRLEHSKITFIFTETFARLRILELTSLGMITAEYFCSFLTQLKELRRLMLAGVSNTCILEAIRSLGKYKQLKYIRLFKHNFPMKPGTLCRTIPPDVEHLHLSIDNGPRNLSELTCFKKLKTLVVQYPTQNVTHLEASAPTVFLQSMAIVSKSNVFNKIKLTGTRAVTFDSLSTESTGIPPAPLAVTLRFTSNGFRFVPGVNPFPDHRNVRLLDLSNNPIDIIPDGAFDVLPKLSVLILQKTNLTKFGDATFCNLRWPRAINLGYEFPKMTSVGPRPKKGGQQWNTLKCLMTQQRESHVIYQSDVCNCKEIRFHYVSREIRKRAFTSEGVICTNGESVGLFGSYERYCLKWTPAERRRPLRMARLSNKKPMPICKNKKILLACFCLWMAYVPFCWIPPIILQILHRRRLRKLIIQDQLTYIQKRLFIICPRHARQWCKKIIVPCLEADLFQNKAPKLRQIRTDRQTRERSGQISQTRQITNSSDSEDKPINMSNVKKTDGIVASSSQITTPSAASIRNAVPKGPWAWHPRYRCRMAPPARHRLGQMMTSWQVVIIFPSTSLFSEPACRAQIRLTFHLYRLNRIPPPALIVWPITRAGSAVPKNFRLFNRSKNRLDEDKYFVAPKFDSIRNDPEDVAETATIKAKVPSREETIEILQYFATLTSPCVHWSNMKTVRENLEPLVWWMNKASQIPAY